MKISDLKNYNITPPEKQKISFFAKKKKKVPNAKIMMMSFADFTLCTILRVVCGVSLFKFLTKDVPFSQLQEIKTNEEMQVFFREFGLWSHAFIVFLTVFVLGAFYYIFLIAKTEKGTVGSWFTNLRFRLPSGERPGVFQAIVWYFTKSLYPICGMIFIIMFFYYGVSLPSFVFFGLTALLSNIPSMIFGIRTLAEIISSITIVQAEK